MPHDQVSQDTKLGAGPSGQSSAQVLMDVQGLKDEEGAVATASSLSSSSFASIRATPGEEAGHGKSSCPQNPKDISSSQTAMAFSNSSQFCEGPIQQGAEGPSPSQDKDVPQAMQDESLNDKLDELVPFVLQKFEKKEQITVDEMLHVVDRDYHEHFPVIFRNLCECLYLCFGIKMKKVGPPGRTYELVSDLGLTYSGLLDNKFQMFLKADLLTLILSTIIIKGNRLSEEDLKELLREKKGLGETEHFAIGEPWKFITEDLVREGYLVHQQVPNSDPACYEFLWGPRAHAETTQIKVLKHMFNF
nr:melanoma-associated antigen 4-like [Cavia porcellus]